MKTNVKKSGFSFCLQSKGGNEESLNNNINLPSVSPVSLSKRIVGQHMWVDLFPVYLSLCNLYKVKFYLLYVIRVFYLEQRERLKVYA